MYRGGDNVRAHLPRDIIVYRQCQRLKAHLLCAQTRRCSASLDEKKGKHFEEKRWRDHYTFDKGPWKLL